MDIDKLVDELLAKHEFAQKHKIAYQEVDENWRYICPCAEVDDVPSYMLSCVPSCYDIVKLDGKLWKHQRYTICYTNAFAQYTIDLVKNTYAKSKFIDFRSKVKVNHVPIECFIPHIYWRNMKEQNNEQH